MRALALLLLAAPAWSGGMSWTPAPTKQPSVEASTITITGTGYSIQATNGNVYAKYGVKASSIALPNGGAVNITNSLDIDQEILSLDSANTVNLGNSSGLMDVRIGANVNVILNSSGGDKVGIGTASPATTLDVNGSAQFGSGATKSTFTAAGLFVPYAAELATIQAWTPTAAELGGFVTCSDCADAYSVCQATGTTIQGFRLGLSGTSECK